MPHSSRRRLAAACVLLAVVLALYSYPSYKTTAELGPRNLPPIFAPDLTLYLNLSSLTPTGADEVVNPYYRIPVPRNGAGYLKFGFAARLFGDFNRMFGGRTSLALFTWNAFWWACLCASAAYVFQHFLPPGSEDLVIFGVCLLMFFNFGVAKSILLAWLHLPSLGAFNTVGLPFMRAFVPVIPCALLLGYLGLQMEALRRRSVAVWLAMAAVQLFALAVFPYATLLMAGVTAVSVLAQPIRPSASETWRIAAGYAVVCALLDGAFLLNGSVGFYENRSRAIQFQPHILPHLVGWSWGVLLALTLGAAFNKKLAAGVKWPLVGLGATNVLLMLGDAVVPATRILLSHHSGYFLHTSSATLSTFLAPTVFSLRPNQARWGSRGLVAVLSTLVLVNGVLIVSGTSRSWLPANRDVAELSNLPRSWNPTKGDIIIARSKDVDDACGWMSLISSSPVLFCTDAEVMLTPQQNRDVHRFRQALYLYLSGEKSGTFDRELSAADPSSLMYRLGYWAEAVSNSPEERERGTDQIRADLLPVLQGVESHDAPVSEFLHGYTRIIVIDKEQNRTFDPVRLDSLLKLGGRTHFNQFVVSFYSPR